MRGEARFKAAVRDLDRRHAAMAERAVADFTDIEVDDVPKGG